MIFLTFITVIFNSCSTLKYPPEVATNYYFYFEEENNKMIIDTLKSVGTDFKTYTYRLVNSKPIQFHEVLSSDPDSIKYAQRQFLEPGDTLGLGVKDFNWLNELNDSKRNTLVDGKPKKDFYLIIRKMNDQNFELVKVFHLDEVE